MRAENSPKDIYRDFSAFYDLYVDGWLDDLPQYLEQARRARTPILEIGAGTGRLTLPLARSGVSIVAVDISPSMLALLHARLGEEPPNVRARIRILQADVRTLALRQSFDLILVPFYTFNYLLTPADQDAGLERLHAHLTPAGRLLIDVFIPWQRLTACPTEPVLRVDRYDLRWGDRIRGWNRYEIDPEANLEIRHQAFEVRRPDGTLDRREFTIRRRFTLPAELEARFARHGLVIESVTTGYKDQPAQSSSEQLLYTLRRSA
jgi:SAM-dependent methyltransferase